MIWLAFLPLDFSSRRAKINVDAAAAKHVLKYQDEVFALARECRF